MCPPNGKTSSNLIIHTRTNTTHHQSMIPVHYSALFSSTYLLVGLLLWTMSVDGILTGLCPVGRFACNDSSQCVEQRYNCDGQSQCQDGSDEWHCADRHSHDFWNKLFRKRPDEDSDKLADGGCDLKAAVPTSCFCSAKRLFCENDGLSSVPNNMPLDTTHLDVSGNFITRIEPANFHNMSKMDTLILSNCRLSHIEPGTFQELLALRKLYLTGNELKSLQGSIFPNLSILETLDLSFNKIETLQIGVFDGLIALRELDLRKNAISDLPPGIFDDLQNLEILYITNNEIRDISQKAFYGMDSLEDLLLSGNKLVHVTLHMFDNLTTLLHLDLSNNQLAKFEEKVFESLTSLTSLNLRKNHFRKVPINTFKPLQSLSYIYFDDFWQCAFALHVRVCEPKGDGISSVENLLANPLLRASVWIVAVCACCGNAMVLVGRILVKEPNEVHSFYIKNLSCADFFMGVYLLIIAVYDCHYRGEYIYHEASWRLSWQCNLCGFLSTLSSEASVIILAIITFDRYMSISRPLSVKRRNLKFAAICMGTLWSAVIVIALLPAIGVPYYGNEFYGNNGVCLPLHIHEPFAQAWEYSLAMFIGLNSLSFAFIVYAYVQMFLIIKDSAISLRSTQSTQDRVIAKRFAFIVATDFICWVPIIVIKALALCGIAIDQTLYAWLAVFVLPVNSALNPILYTLTTKLFKQQIFRWFYLCKSSWWRDRGHGHRGVDQPGIDMNNSNKAGGHDHSGLSLSYVFFHRRSWSKRAGNSASTGTTTARSSIKSASSLSSTKRSCRISNHDLQQGTLV